MILLICDDIGTRMEYSRYLRRKRVLTFAPQPIDFESAIKSGKYKVILFFCPFSPVLGTIYCKDVPRIAIGACAERYSAHMNCCEDPYSPVLLSFLKDIEAYGRRRHAGDMAFRGDKVINAGYRLGLTPEEYSVVMYILCRGPSTPEDIGDACIGKLFIENPERKKHDIVTVISQINRKALDVGGRRVIRLRKGAYEFCDADECDDE